MPMAGGEGGGGSDIVGGSGTCFNRLVNYINNIVTMFKGGGTTGENVE